MISFYLLLSTSLPVSGFSDKAALLVETVVSTLFDLSKYLTQDALNRQVELLKRAYCNADMKPSEAASSSRVLALAPMRHSCDSKLEELSGDRNDVQRYSDFLCRLYDLLSLPSIHNTILPVFSSSLLILASISTSSRIGECECQSGGVGDVTYTGKRV